MSDAQRDRRGPPPSDPGPDPTGEEQSLGLEDVRFEEPEQPSDGRVSESSSGGVKALPIEVRVVGRSDVGLVREHNEDNYLLADLATGSRDPAGFHEVPREGLVLAVCDGMGGAAAGEVASQLAVDTIYDVMSRSAHVSDRDGFARALVRAIEEAGARIFEAARADRSRRGMGTTSTVAALMDKTLFVGQVGDSRAYVLRSGELKQVTKDQSLVNQLIEAGQLTEDEAEAFEHSNIILQALGTTEQVSVDLTFLELRRGDRLLLCSDGLSGLVHGDVIREVMTEYRDLNACCERLIELAKAGGGHDNVTVLLCDFGGEGLALPAPGDLAGYQQYPLPLHDHGQPLENPNSDLPTLAPPGSSMHGRDSAADEFGDIQGAARKSSGANTRFLLLALVIIATACAVYLLQGSGEESALDPEGRAVAAPPTALAVATPARVEVVVRTDVEGAELHVDGESFGLATEGRWVLDLPPGPHKLEAVAGGNSVTSSLVAVREGVPATVLLSMPQEKAGPDAGLAKTLVPEVVIENGSEDEKARADRRERRRRARASEQDVAPPAPATPSTP
jgi:serine/threonine protein phosphatase PrpC